MEEEGRSEGTEREEREGTRPPKYSGLEPPLQHCCTLANNVENMDCVQV